MKKFKLGLESILIFLMIFFSSNQEDFILLLIFLLFHEISHVIMLNIFKVPILNFRISIIGCFLYINSNKNDFIYKEIIIYLAGIFMNLILAIIGRFLGIYKMYYLNLYLLVYNILPFYPLDGFMILLSLLRIFFPNYKALKYAHIINGIFLIYTLYLIVIFKFGLVFYFMFFIFISNLISFGKNLKISNKNMLIEKYLYPNIYLRDKHISLSKNIDKLFYKGRYNYTNYKKCRIEEDKLLSFVLLKQNSFDF